MEIKNVLNRPYGFEIYLVNVKTMRTIAQIFVAFSKKVNFNMNNKWLCWAVSSCKSLLSKNYGSFTVKLYLPLAFWTAKINVIKLIFA